MEKQCRVLIENLAALVDLEQLPDAFQDDRDDGALAPCEEVRIDLEFY